ncbi:MAG: hypothetical protein H8D71_00105, partial [Deltaproteobacteria bacterium]|nr:hypothetical protein [Deltaproteobacteria bacterium]
RLTLMLRPGDLPPSGTADPRVRNITITRNLITCVDHDDPTLHLIGKNTGNFSQCCGLSHARSSHQQQRLSTVEKVTHHRHGAKDCTTNTTGEADHLSLPISDGTDPVEGPLNSGAIISPETTQFVDHVGQIISRNRTIA